VGRLCAVSSHRHLEPTLPRNEFDLCWSGQWPPDITQRHSRHTLVHVDRSDRDATVLTVPPRLCRRPSAVLDCPSLAFGDWALPEIPVAAARVCICRVTFCYSRKNFDQSRLSGLSSGAFINSTYWIGSCVPAVRQLVTETGLIVCQYTVRRRQYDRLSQQQPSSCFFYLDEGLCSRYIGLQSGLTGPRRSGHESLFSSCSYKLTTGSWDGFALSCFAIITANRHFAGQSSQANINVIL